VSERQVDQETVAIVQPAEDECRNKGMEYGRRYAATNASQLTQGGKAAGRCLSLVQCALLFPTLSGPTLCIDDCLTAF